MKKIDNYNVKAAGTFQPLLVTIETWVSSFPQKNFINNCRKNHIREQLFFLIQTIVFWLLNRTTRVTGQSQVAWWIKMSPLRRRVSGKYSKKLISQFRTHGF